MIRQLSEDEVVWRNDCVYAFVVRDSTTGSHFRKFLKTIVEFFPETQTSKKKTYRRTFKKKNKVITVNLILLLSGEEIKTLLVRICPKTLYISSFSNDDGASWNQFDINNQFDTKNSWNLDDCLPYSGSYPGMGKYYLSLKHKKSGSADAYNLLSRISLGKTPLAKAIRCLCDNSKQDEWPISLMTICLMIPESVRFLPFHDFMIRNFKKPEPLGKLYFLIHFWGVCSTSFQLTFDEKKTCKREIKELREMEDFVKELCRCEIEQVLGVHKVYESGRNLRDVATKFDWFKIVWKKMSPYLEPPEEVVGHEEQEQALKGFFDEDGFHDQKKGTETENNEKHQKVKELCHKASTIKCGILGKIFECGGKIHMAERQWAEAAIDFFKAFENYDEACNNHERCIECLKHLVLAYMLMESEVNPFDGQKAKRYKNDPKILEMMNLFEAYQMNEISKLEKILESIIMVDPFIRNHKEDLLKNVRTRVLIKLIKPYSRIRIPFISKKLNVPENDVEELLVSLILDSQIDGHIDQVNRHFERGDRSKQMKNTAIDKWNTQLFSLYQSVGNRACRRE